MPRATTRRILLHGREPGTVAEWFTKMANYLQARKQQLNVMINSVRDIAETSGAPKADVELTMGRNVRTLRSIQRAIPGLVEELKGPNRRQKPKGPPARAPRRFSQPKTSAKPYPTLDDNLEARKNQLDAIIRWFRGMANTRSDPNGNIDLSLRRHAESLCEIEQAIPDLIKQIEHPHL